ncbi:MAG: CopG family transcriptional regulator [Chloroflexota bacterium]|jgi:predicted transcriptional regulator
MHRTTISLPDEVAAGLQREAGRRRVPVSQVAREAIEAYLGRPGGERRQLRFAGIGHSGHHDTAASFEEVLEQEWGD